LFRWIATVHYLPLSTTAQVRGALTPRAPFVAALHRSAAARERHPDARRVASACLAIVLVYAARDGGERDHTASFVGA
jgi:hypothetical protein